MWTNTLSVPESDGNCCLAFQVDNNEQVLCEVSAFCIVRAKKLMRFLIEDCRANQSSESGVTPKHKTDIPFYKNEQTYNYGWDPLLMYKDPAEAAAEAEAEAAKAAAEAEAAEAEAELEKKKTEATPEGESAIEKAKTEENAEEAAHKRGKDASFLDNHKEG